MTAFTRRDFVAASALARSRAGRTRARRRRCRSQGHLQGDRAPPRRIRQAAAGVDRSRLDRGRERRDGGGLRPDAPARARCRLPARRVHADQGSSGRVRDARRRRTAHARAVLHVRRQAGQSGGMVVAAVGGAARRHAGARQGRDGAWRRESEGSAVGVPGRAARDPRRRPQDSRQPGAGRGRRGRDRLAEFPADRALARSERRAVEERRRVHARGRAGMGRQRDHHARQQGRHRVRPDRERREVGPWPDRARRALVACGAPRSTRMAPGAGAEHAGDAERRSGNRWLLRESRGR